MDGKAPPRLSEQSHDLVRVSSRRSSIFNPLKQVIVAKDKPSGRKVRMVVIDGGNGVRHVSPRDPVLKGRLDVVDEDGFRRTRHFFARLYETGKKVLQRGEGILSGLDGGIINLGPDDDSPWSVPDAKRNRAAGTMQSLDEYPVTGKIKIQGDAPVATGGYCEVFQGTLRRKGKTPKDDELVALKCLKVGLTPDSDRKMFRRETNAWNKLHHPNVLPFYGTVIHKHHIFMVSPWAHNGTLIPYLKRNPGVDCKALLVQISSALSYIHNECKIVHGDVKAGNVFVSLDGAALVADFGLATHIERLPGVTATSQAVRTAMTPRFSAPELLLAAADSADNEGPLVSSIKSRATDVYAFGMVIIQVYTLERPWGDMTTERVLAQVLQGHKPKKPEGDAVSRGLTPLLWKLVEKCLESHPADRPSMADLAVSIAEGSIPVGAADLSGAIIQEQPISKGFEKALWVGQRRQGKSGETVILSTPKKGHLIQAQKILRREVQILSLVQHPNILPFYGTAEIRSHLFIVTPWMDNGDITTYLGNNPQANRVRLLHQTSDALSYLHSGRGSTVGPVVHGSLQPRNVLISDGGDALVTDFGLSNLLEDLEISGTTDSQVNDTSVRFHPPEFFNSDHGPTEKSDVYSFAMLMYQVLTDKVPFSDAKNYFAVINRIIRGKIPERPRAGGKPIDDSMWELLVQCWSYNPEDRPSMDQVRDRLASSFQLQIDNTLSIDRIRTRLAIQVGEPQIVEVD